jgi:SAM-dependent methyltransferase
MDSYQRFESAVYLHDYYRTVAPDMWATLRFLVAALRDLPPDAALLDFGGGPTLYTALVAAPRVAMVHVSDYSAPNRAAVRAWLERQPHAFDWNAYSAAILELEGVEPTRAAIAAREALLRRRLGAVLACDATAADPLASERLTVRAVGGPAPAAPRAQYDVVCSNMCLEAVARDAAEWGHYLRNLATLLRPGGLLTLATVRRCSVYSVGETLFPVACLDEADVRGALCAAGFDPTTVALEIVPSNHPAFPYQGLMLTSALKATAP